MCYRRISDDTWIQLMNIYKVNLELLLRHCAPYISSPIYVCANLNHDFSMCTRAISTHTRARAQTHTHTHTISVLPRIARIKHKSFTPTHKHNTAWLPSTYNLISQDLWSYTCQNMVEIVPYRTIVRSVETRTYSLTVRTPKLFLDYIYI
jgi:hypothetical protein